MLFNRCVWTYFKSRIITSIYNCKYLNKKGFNVVRHNLSQEPQAFVQNQLISELLKTKGSKALPITLFDGKVVKSGSYPSRKELAEWLKIEVSELSSAIITKKHKCCSED